MNCAAGGGGRTPGWSWFDPRPGHYQEIRSRRDTRSFAWPRRLQPPVRPCAGAWPAVTLNVYPLMDSRRMDAVGCRPPARLTRLRPAEAPPSSAGSWRIQPEARPVKTEPARAALWPELNRGRSSRRRRQGDRGAGAGGPPASGSAALPPRPPGARRWHSRRDSTGAPPLRLSQVFDRLP